MHKLGSGAAEGACWGRTLHNAVQSCALCVSVQASAKQSWASTGQAKQGLGMHSRCQQTRGAADSADGPEGWLTPVG